MATARQRGSDDSGTGGANKDTAGVVLAGGRSSRMGHDKASLLIAGEPLLQRVVGRVRQALAEVLVVGPQELKRLVPGVRVIPDVEVARGPLGGLVTALQTVDTSWIFVVGCDMPFVEPALVSAMVAQAAAHGECDALVLRSERGAEPLHAVYSCACLPRAVAQLASGDRSMHRFLGGLRVCELGRAEVAQYDPRGLSSFNANNPQEWAHALALALAEH
jgi:molybdopterin-guanine dinucleotide biosynthesis protein A